MNRSYNPKSEKQTIYEIFRACRLCGAGGGYKMPIIQNVVDLDDTETELRQKIKECVQIEVDAGDKMPPLICELCIDKVNDFYEFLELCQLTNKRTRQRLGLPQQTARGASEQEDCILGVTEPVFVNDDSEDEPLLGPGRKGLGLKVKKSDPEKVLVIKLEKTDQKLNQKPACSKDAKQLPRKGRVPSPTPPRSPVRSRDTKPLSRKNTRVSPSPSSSPIRVIDSGPLSRKTRVPSPARVRVSGPLSRRTRVPSPARVRDSGPLSRRTRVPSPARARDSRPLSRKTRLPSPSPSSSPVRAKDGRPQSRKNTRLLTPSPPSSPVRGRDSLSRKNIGVPPPSPPRGKPRPASRKVRVPSPPPSPKRITKDTREDDEKSSRSSKSDIIGLKVKRLELTKAQKGILKKEPWPTEKEKEVEEPPKVAKKRPAEKVSKPSPVPVKKVKPATPKPPPPVECKICHVLLKTIGALSNHLRTHYVTYTNPRLACNACGEWFDSPDDAQAHHKTHRAAHTPYRCESCFDSFSSYAAFNEHHEGNSCGRYTELPDVTCAACLRAFPTWPLRDDHRCPGEDGRPGGKCSKCRRSYALLKNLTKHEATCTARKRGQLIIDPEVMKEIRPAQMVVARCDALLTRVKGGHVDVTRVSSTYGLDSHRHYPFFNTTLRVKTDPDGMVNITDDVLDYVHWDSDYTSDGDTTSIDSGKPRQVESLTSLTLKVIYSNKFLGKLPKRRRKKIKVEKVKTEVDIFDSVMNGEESFNKDIDNIISSLDTAWEEGSDAGDKSILTSLMDISLPDFTSTVRFEEDSVEKIVEDNENISRTEDDDVASGVDKLVGNERKCQEKTEENDTAETRKVGEKIRSTNSVKSNEMNNAIDIKKEVTEQMDVNDESVKLDLESIHSTCKEACGEDTEVGKIEDDVKNANGDVTKDGATSQDDLTNIVTNKEDLPSAVSHLTDTAKGQCDLPEGNTASDVQKADENASDKDLDDSSKEGTDDIINSTANEETSHNDYVESQTFTENFDDHFKSDRDNSDNYKTDTADEKIDLDTSITDDLEQKKDAYSPINDENDSKIVETHQNNAPARSKAKSDDFSMENILKPNNEHFHTNSDLENKIRPIKSNGTITNNMSGTMAATEAEDKQLMDALDAEIGERDEQKNCKSVNTDSESVNKVSSPEVSVKKDSAMDLDNVSDDDYNFDS